MSAPRNRSVENRFYCAPPMRKQNQEQQQQQPPPRQSKLNRAAKPKPAPPSTAAAEKGVVESDDNCSSSSANTASFSSPVGPSCNLDRFLEHTTPVVPAQYLSKTSMKQLRTSEDKFHPFFMLGDLWESFKEWSAYGAGVPLVLNGSDSVVQYYVPFLSGIQLYIDPSKPSMSLRLDWVEKGVFQGGLVKRVMQIHPGKLVVMVAVIVVPKEEPIMFRVHGACATICVQWPKVLTDFQLTKARLATHLVYFYLNISRVLHHLAVNPWLIRQIAVLASRFPQLKTCRSYELTPASWISVAWYPIYRIPTGPTLQNLDACFLTFHSLSTPFTSSSSTDSPHVHVPTARQLQSAGVPLKLLLPIFGLASYKFKVSVWNPDGVHESQKVNSLLRAADNWLRLLQVDHPDYKFFVSHNLYI
ncbi:hypothetical protein RHMOL_Rhmol04G0366400 [Rhododendron molle]|uniref:Uncharacterized protein n=1 Tax=Rhododendron molle TaxID=49168 RepID=A0ACC0P7V0_RHOML|nr:hypothetical protein RHMOL_Rhmol04G0366400 [Rhododendron molle]